MALSRIDFAINFFKDDADKLLMYCNIVEPVAS